MFRASSCPSSGGQYKADNAYGVQHCKIIFYSAAHHRLCRLWLFSWWWAWWCPKHVETPINTPSFLHLLVIYSPSWFKMQGHIKLKYVWIYCIYTHIYIHIYGYLQDWDLSFFFNQYRFVRSTCFLLCLCQYMTKEGGPR
jgi:hypothetical protein